MSKMTLLEIVQDILNDMNDDEVNSITDTLESVQVAQIVKSTYYEVLSGGEWKHLNRLKSLQHSGEVSKPTHLKMGDDDKELRVFEYNKRKESSPTKLDYQEVPYIEPDEFLRKTSNYDNTLDNVDTITDFSGAKFNIKNDRHPEVFTSFDDVYLVFDSYDSEQEATLQESQNRATVVITPSWSVTDSFVPDLPIDAFPGLLAECKSVCFSRLKQQVDQKSEQQARRQRNKMSRKGWKVNGNMPGVNYARRSRKC